MLEEKPKQRPNIKGEMDELERVSQDLSRDEGVDVSVDELVNAFKKSKEQTLPEEIWAKLENTESNQVKNGQMDLVKKIAKKFNKTDPETLAKSIKSGEYRRPMIVKYDNDRYHLVAGNTRLCTAAALGIAPKVFIADISDSSNKVDLNEKCWKGYTQKGMKTMFGKRYPNCVKKTTNEASSAAQQAAIAINMKKKGVSPKNESELIKGGNADHKSLIHIAKKHDAKGYYHIDNMVQSLKRQLEMGIKIEMEHTDNENTAKEIAMDHLWEDPTYYTKLKRMEKKDTTENIDKDLKGDQKDMVYGIVNILKKVVDVDNRRKIANDMIKQFKRENIDFDYDQFLDMCGCNKKVEAKEMTGADSAGAYSAPAFGGKKTVVNKIHNMNEEQELDEVTDASSSGAFDVPLFGGTKGRKSPLSIGGPDTIYKGRAVKDKKFPKWGGPGGKFVKIKDKCKKYPYCTQGDMSALELLESDEVKLAIQETAKKYGISIKEVNNLVLNQIKGIFI